MGLVALAFGGFVLGLLPMIGWAARTATDSVPVWMLLPALVWIPVAALAGAAAEAWLGWRRAGIGSVILATVFWGISRGPAVVTDHLQFLPFTGMLERPGGEVGWNPWLFVLRVIVGLVVGLVLLRAVTRKARGGSVVNERGIGDLLIWGCLGVVGAAAAVQVQPHVVLRDPDLRCGSGELVVCVLAGHERDLGEVEDLVRLFANEAGPALLPVELVSEAVTAGPGVVRIAIGPEKSASVSLDVGSQVATAIAGMDRCGIDESHKAFGAYRLVAVWFMERAEVFAAGEQGDPGAERTLVEWRKRPAGVTSALRGLASTIHACALTLDMLP
ncbi:hypothetical protein OG394_37490 [Kribbella sp. NBC_01245]|uniref:hypothetical protein n=1 Tax=Kribbella sp. NBC_01245 TaxID=2903578 RepID=UPI002E2D4B77|nr:hypothetical protein [Kribbella sp. NBC_01245]